MCGTFVIGKAPTPKWMLPRVCFVLTDIASPVDQTGEAFLFLLVSLIEKGKKRYNQTSKGHEQAQYTYNYRDNFESCHTNAPPFLCNPKIRYRLGRLPPCHGYSSYVFTTQFYYTIYHKAYQLFLERLFCFHSVLWSIQRSSFFLSAYQRFPI